MIGRFSDLDLFVSLVFKIEPSTVAFSKAPMAVRGCRKLGVVRKFGQRGKRLFSRV